MTNRNDRGEGAVWIGLIIILVTLGMLVLSIVSALHTEEMTCTIQDKDRTTNREGKSDARLYTEDCGVLRVGDSLLSWTWSSADTYAGIDEGKTYHIKTRGLRIPFLSMFPNVVEATEVDR
jgi:hypothetical protein